MSDVADLIGAWLLFRLISPRVMTESEVNTLHAQETAQGYTHSAIRSAFGTRGMG